MRNKIIITILLFASLNDVYADNKDIQKIMSHTLKQQDALKNNAYHYLKNYQPKENFTHYSESPAESNYYAGVTQQGTSQLDQDTVITKNNSDTGKIINSSIHSRPEFVIHSSDPSMMHSQFISENAEEIVKGITNRYINCKVKEICKMDYVNKICNEEPQQIFHSSRKTLNIDVIPHETVTHYPLKIHVITRNHHYAGVVVNIVTGGVSFVGPHDTSFRLDGRLPNNLDCNTLQGSITDFNTNNRNTKLDSLVYPSCSAGMYLNFHLSGCASGRPACLMFL